MAVGIWLAGVVVVVVPEAPVVVCATPAGLVPVGEAPLITSSANCADSDWPSANSRVMRATASTTNVRWRSA